MTTWVIWLKATAMSEAFRGPEGWLWPAFESVHFLGLALVFGVAGFFDLRLLGFNRWISLPQAARFLPLAMAGFIINLITGLYFYIAQPFSYSFNSAWWYKVAAIAVAVGNAGYFEVMLKSKIVTLRDDEDTPVSFKIVGLLSLLAWLNVLFWGRMLPFWSPPVGGGVL